MRSTAKIPLVVPCAAEGSWPQAGVPRAEFAQQLPAALAEAFGTNARAAVILQHAEPETWRAHDMLALGALTSHKWLIFQSGRFQLSARQTSCVETNAVNILMSH